MKKLLFSALFLLLALGFAQAQAVSINTDSSNPDPSAILDVKSTEKGILVPRMTTAQRTAIAAPATGLLVFDTDTGGFWVYTGSAWRALSAVLADADGDTKIQVEESPDEDIIRMDLAGSERLVLKRNTGGNTLLELPNTLNNTFLGTGAGNSNTTGRANVAIGVAALNKSATRSYLVAVGDSALYNNSVGAQELYHGTVNTALGSKALFSNTLGDANTATGYRALYANTSGYSNTASGAGTLLSNTSGYNNTAMGFSALESNTTGRINTAVGMNVLKNNTTGNSNTAMGVQALYSNTTGYSNVAVGNNALFRNTTSSFSVAVGDSALYNNGNGVPPIEDPYAVGNSALGAYSLFANTVGSYNTATGLRTLNENTTGNYNTATGVYALRANQTGWYNTAVGMEALRNNVGGEENTATGTQALKSNSSGRLNTATGSYALLFNSTGIQNTAFGAVALSSNTTGSSNTALGFNADVETANLTNATAIGANAAVNASNSLVLGSINGVNGATSSVNVGIGTTAPTERLQVGGNIFASGGDFYAASANGVINAGGGIMNTNLNVIADAIPTPLNVGGDEDLYIEDDLELGGQGYKPGGGTWVTPSDARLKKDITPYTDGLAQVLQVKPVRYRYNDVFPIPDGGKEYVGILAQDMAQIAPYMVEMKPFGQRVEEDARGNERIIDPGTPYYTYDGTALTYMLVNAVQEQQAEIEKLKRVEAENTALKAQVETLKTRLDKITAVLQSAGIGVGNGER